MTFSLLYEEILVNGKNKSFEGGGEVENPLYLEDCNSWPMCQKGDCDFLVFLKIFSFVNMVDQAKRKSKCPLFMVGEKVS